MEVVHPGRTGHATRRRTQDQRKRRQWHAPAWVCHAPALQSVWDRSWALRRAGSGADCRSWPCDTAVNRYTHPGL